MAKKRAQNRHDEENNNSKREHAWTRCAVARFLSEQPPASSFLKFMKKSQSSTGNNLVNITTNS